LVPTLGVFGIASLRLKPLASMISNSLSQLRYNRHGVSLLYADVCLLKQKGKLKKIPNTTLKIVKDFREFSINNISFYYPNTKILALKGLSLTICANDSIGLIGASGSGKTTLVNIILGLLEPQEGELLYNGNSLSEESLKDWRSQVAYLPQEVFLIDNSLRCNIAFGEGNDEIDEKLLKEALRKARLAKLVEELPKGVHTHIGEHGVRLSGGQRQRVALARAFYNKRNVLVMDESTSALDIETEKQIVEEIKHLKGQVTMIVIAHRLATAQQCDRIYRLDQGSIVESGTTSQMLPKYSVSKTEYS
jgi:ATP-binding cassette, subfamily B, bacterial PglK